MMTITARPVDGAEGPAPGADLAAPAAAVGSVNRKVMRKPVGVATAVVPVTTKTKKTSADRGAVEAKKGSETTKGAS
ncbi:MAG: hypothetical protein M3N08_05995 [Pseudomonadota bacterium]|nr:hypothetical protein [Pseudomonadota bacterium]